MAIARTEQIDLEATQYYHCTTRCVRRAFLCGTDFETGRDYSHRKKWLVNRFKSLSKYFGINICSYAVMSNHYHLVLFVDCDAVKNWTDDEVKARWAALFPRDAAIQEKMHLKVLENKIIEWRERLTSISWFMRCLNENIALLANNEDKCKGRFWEGRFKTQALLDEGALLAAMAYVDLNPIRANIAKTPENSEFTSIQERIHFALNQLKNEKSSSTNSLKLSKMYDNFPQTADLMPFDNNISPQSSSAIPFSLSEYLELVENTGMIIREDKKGAISDKLVPILMRLNLSASGWLTMTKDLEDKFYYAVGNHENLKDFGQSYQRRKNPKGPTVAKQCYLESVA